MSSRQESLLHNAACHRKIATACVFHIADIFLKSHEHRAEPRTAAYSKAAKQIGHARVYALPWLPSQLPKLTLACRAMLTLHRLPM